MMIIMMITIVIIVVILMIFLLIRIMIIILSIMCKCHSYGGAARADRALPRRSPRRLAPAGGPNVVRFDDYDV